MKLLSPHELALLLCLLNAPGQVAATEPDAIALVQSSLAEVVASDAGDPVISVTSKGMATLRRLGMAPDKGKASTA